MSYHLQTYPINNSKYLFIPVGSKCHPKQNDGLHQCSSNHSRPYSLYKQKNVFNTQQLVPIIKHIKYVGYFLYLYAEVEFEPQKTTKWNSHNVVTPNIYVGNKCLPSTANSHPFNFLKGISTNICKRKQRQCIQYIILNNQMV